MSGRVADWWMAARPKTLTAAAVPVVVGCALAASAQHRLEWLWAICALLGALLIQIGTNFINDAIDFEKGTDDQSRVGPKRVTASGLIPARTVRAAAWISFFLAAVAGIPLVVRGGLPLLVIGLLSIAAGYLYTGGPYPLAYHGLGEPFVILFFGLIAVGGTFYLQALSVSREAIAAGLAVGCLSTVLLAVNNLRDREGDARTGKRTLAVRFGRGFAQREIAILSFLPIALGAFWWARGERAAALLPLLLVPLALSIIRSSSRDEGAALNRTLGKSAALHALYGLLLSIGVLVS